METPTTSGNTRKKGGVNTDVNTVSTLTYSRLLEHLREGLSAAQIARVEKVDKALISRKIKRLVQRGDIVYQEGTFPKIYHILVGHEGEPKSRVVRGHAYKFKFKLIKPPEKPIKQEIKLKNTSQLLEKFGNALLRFTSKHAIVELRDVRTSGKDAGIQNIALATAKAIRILYYFQQRNHFEFNPEPEINKGFHLAIEDDEFIEKLQKSGIRVQGEKYQMDDSPPSHGGELEFVGDPFKIDKYLKAGEKLDEMSTKIDRLTDGGMAQLQRMSKTEEAMLVFAGGMIDLQKSITTLSKIVKDKL